VWEREREGGGERKKGERKKGRKAKGKRKRKS
jgi:hypothetical protein